MQLIAALQVLAAFWYGAFAFHHLTGASTGTSFLIGGVGAFVLVLVVVIKFPRLVLGTATLCWAVAGVMLGHWLFGGIGQALVVGVILAGIGFTANAGFIAEMLASHRKGEAIAESILPPIASAKDREGVLLLWHAVRRLDRIKVLDDDMFRSLNGRCAEILGMPNPPEGSAPPSTHDVADAFGHADGPSPGAAGRGGASRQAGRAARAADRYAARSSCRARLPTCRKSGTVL